MPEDVLYTPEELAHKLKISKYTVYEMIKRGDIKAHHIGRNIRVSQYQLNLYMMSARKADNVYDAEIILEEIAGDYLKYAVVNGIKLTVSTKLEGRVKISISPEDIILSSGTFMSSARNMHKGVVTDIIIDNNHVEITLDIGFPLIALITKQSKADLNINQGDELYAIFKTTSVKVFK